MRRGIALVLLALVACRPETAPEPLPPLPPVGQARVEAAREACRADGGSFRQAGLGKSWVCFTTPKDAGKQCRAASDCESACLARSQTCSPIAPLIGCQEILNAAGARVMQCVD